MYFKCSLSLHFTVNQLIWNTKNISLEISFKKKLGCFYKSSSSKSERAGYQVKVDVHPIQDTSVLQEPKDLFANGFWEQIHCTFQIGLSVLLRAHPMKKPWVVICFSILIKKNSRYSQDSSLKAIITMSFCCLLCLLKNI